MNEDKDPPSSSIAGSSNTQSPVDEGSQKRKSFKVTTKESIAKASDEEVPQFSHNNAVVAAEPPVTRTVSNSPKEVDVLEKEDNDWYEEKTRRGKRPGDRYVRMTRPHSNANYIPGSGLSFTAGDHLPNSGIGRLYQRTKRVLIGKPIASSEAHHQRLTKVQALAVLSSDALSSTAYATEEILLVLFLAGSASLTLGLPIAFCITALLIIVAVSYRQTIAAYPKGGGSYIVAKDNLGVPPGLIAAASLLIDYVLTVAVSISAGVAAVTSAIPVLNDYRVELCLGFVAFITLANLRGVKESGIIFTVPTYIFIFSMVVLLLLGFIKIFFNFSIGSPYPAAEIPQHLHTEELTIFLILRAFASGCTALTGVEAISDGVPAFRAPEAKNARMTLTWMAGILAVLFISITFMAAHFNIHPIEQDADHYQTVVSQIARNIVGDNPFYFLIQASTALILVLAANTAFSDFPRLSWFLARDKFLPNLFKHQGDRLAYSTGIIALGFLAAVLIIAFGGSTNALIPLYAVGVFTSFTLSQAGMVVRWWRLRTPGWMKNIALNGLGCVATFVVLIIIGSTKFLLGAWIVVALIPILYMMFMAIHRHYNRVGQELNLNREKQVPTMTMRHHTAVVPVGDLNQVTLRTLSYARALTDEVTAVYVSDNSEAIESLRERWDEAGLDIPLVGVETPYRNIIGALMTYLDDLHRREPDETITVVIPEFVTARWWQRLLHNQTALRLRSALHNRPGVAITSVPYHLEK